MVDHKRSLLTCYKLSDYCVDQWLVDLWATNSNSEFKTRLLDNKIIAASITYFETTKDYTIENIKELCYRVLGDVDFVTYCLFLWSIYQRENCIGPSVYTEYVEETRAPLIKGGSLPDTPFDLLSNKNENL